eukprot:3840751-Rhodomonas_salina.1
MTEHLVSSISPRPPHQKHTDDSCGAVRRANREDCVLLAKSTRGDGAKRDGRHHGEGGSRARDGSQLARDRLRGAGVPRRDGGRRVHATGDAGEAVYPGLLTGNRERQVQGVGDFDVASEAGTGSPVPGTTVEAGGKVRQEDGPLHHPSVPSPGKPT